LILIYYLLLWVLWIIFFIPILFLSFFKDKYKTSLKARFFLYKNVHQYPADVHFHVCSLGEARSVKDLAVRFDSRITSITQTGFDEAKTFCKKVNFLAFEIFLPFWFKPCKALVIFEAEYWLMLVFIAKLKGSKVLLINARISDKSYKSYLKFSFFYTKIFSYIDEIFCQSKEDATRLLKLGAKNVHIFKNIKANLDIKRTKFYEKLDARLIIFANTHKGEEELLLDHFSLEENDKLILAPRHPERFKELEKLLLNSNISFEKFSSLNLNNPLKQEFKAQILLLDVLGELINFYAVSDVVVLGGSFIQGIGGHNPIEAAYFDNVLITGKYIYNQKSLFDELENVYFCENLDEIQTLINNAQIKAKIHKNNDLSPIINAIQEGIDARKSL